LGRLSGVGRTLFIVIAGLDFIVIAGLDQQSNFLECRRFFYMDTPVRPAYDESMIEKSRMRAFSGEVGTGSP
jgi:hypothetical protein